MHKTCEEMITENDILIALRKLINNESPENDWTTKEFYEIFWNDWKDVLSARTDDAFGVAKLPISQRQIIIKLIFKKRWRWNVH